MRYGVLKYIGSGLEKPDVPVKAFKADGLWICDWNALVFKLDEVNF